MAIHMSCLRVRSSVPDTLKLERYHPYLLPQFRVSRRVQLPFVEATCSIQTDVFTQLSAVESLRLAREMALEAALRVQHDLDNNLHSNEHVVDLLLALRLRDRRAENAERRSLPPN